MQEKVPNDKYLMNMDQLAIMADDVAKDEAQVQQEPHLHDSPADCLQLLAAAVSLSPSSVPGRVRRVMSDTSLQGNVVDWERPKLPPLPYGARESEAGPDNHPLRCVLDAATKGAACCGMLPRIGCVP